MILVEIAGFLGADPEERFTASGKRVVNLRVATRVRKGGQDETVWWRVSVWGDRFDKMISFLKKGSSVIIVGEMNVPQTYVSKDGSTKVSMEMTAEIIKFSPFGKPEERSGQQPGQQQAAPQVEQKYATYGATSEPDNAFAGDDLPF